MKHTLHIVLTILCLIPALVVNAQTCGTDTFTPPASPSNCAYTYTNTGLTGWQDGAGNDTAAPPVQGSGSNIGTDVCILADLNYNFAKLVGNTFYVAPGVTFTGDADSINCTLIIEGTAFFNSTPGSTGATFIYIYPSGNLTLSGDLTVSSGDEVHNAGTLNVGVVNTSPTPNLIGDLDVSSTFWSYSDSLTVVTGDAGISGTYNNCGLFEIYGNIATQGSS